MCVFLATTISSFHLILSTAHSWLFLKPMPTFSSLICLYDLDPVVIIIMCVVSNINYKAQFIQTHYWGSNIYHKASVRLNYKDILCDVTMYYLNPTTSSYHESEAKLKTSVNNNDNLRV